MNRVGRAFLHLLIAASVLWMVRAARAQDAAAQSAAARPVRLVLSPGPSPDQDGLSPDRLRDAIATELGRTVIIDDGSAGAADVLTVIYEPAREGLTVFYRPHGGRAVVRTVRAPSTAAEVEALAVLLAGNLARDQASELLGPPASADPPAAPPAISEAVEPLPATPTVTRDWRPGLLDGITVRPLFWGSTGSWTNLGVSFADSFGYALLHVSGHLEEGARMVGPGLAIGTRVPVRQFASESDIGLTYMHGLDPHAVMGSMYGYTNNRLVTRARTALAFSPFPGFSVFTGVAFALTTHLYGVVDNEWAPELFGGFAL